MGEGRWEGKGGGEGRGGEGKGGGKGREKVCNGGHLESLQQPSSWGIGARGGGVRQKKAGRRDVVVWCICRAGCGLCLNSGFEGNLSLLEICVS